MADVTALRDGLVDEFYREGLDMATFVARLDALIAAVEARAALTPERLALQALRALVGMSEGLYVINGYREQWQEVERLVNAALATDEAVP